jgi:CHAD domain-containing protein
MADGKWVAGLMPAMPVDEAARRVLRARLDAVAHWLPKAAQESGKDEENVHQLRVSTRRADAGLRIFRASLPGKAYRDARARLRSMRRAAGAARDWDVFLKELRGREGSAPEKERAGLELLIGYALGQRAAAQPGVEALGQKSPFGDFTEEVVGRVRPEEGGPGSLIELGRPLLEVLFEKLEGEASGDLSDYEHLHQVRITGKRLRYAMEVFADCFGRQFRESAYPRVEEMQDVLGLANDSHVATVRLSGLRATLRGWGATWERARPGVESLLRFHQRRLSKQRKQFEAWLSRWRGTDLGAVLREPAVEVGV